MEPQFNDSDTTHVAGFTNNHDYKRKTSHVADTDILLPDTLNMFFARFEENTGPPTRLATKDRGLSFSVANVSKTFKRVTLAKLLAQSASLAAPSEHAQTSWPVC